MSRINTKKPSAITINIDALLQDSYLLVVQLRQGASVPEGPQLMELCVNQVESVRQQLKEAGLSRRNVDYISHAQCALLDETVLSCAKAIAHTDWASKPLQARFFNRHQAGDSLYEDLRDVLHEPAPDRQVLTVFQRVLMLGFQGRYHEADDPEREQLLAALTAQVPPLELSQALPTHVDGRHRLSFLSGLRSPLAQGVAVGLLLIAAWWGLNHLLADVLITSLPGEA